MGLDISAYAVVRPLTDAERESIPEGDREDPRDWWYLTKQDSSRLDTFFSQFPGPADGLVGRTMICEGKTIQFRAGSYSGYNWWREELARMLGTTPRAVWDDPRPGPFVELIHNSDCESVIGPVTSAKLAKDFGDWAEKAAEFASRFDGGDGWLDHYDKWASAFRLAAGGGCVVFH